MVEFLDFLHFLISLVKFFLADADGRAILKLIPVEIVDRFTVFCYF